MASEILINVHPNQTRVAHVESGALLDLKVERKSSPTMVGSIYKGRVIRVLPGMQAAFVDLGLSRAGFLYVADIKADLLKETEILLDDGSPEGDASATLIDSNMEKYSRDVPQVPIQDILTPGQSLMVQVAKDPLGTKGSRVTTPYFSSRAKSCLYAHD